MLILRLVSYRNDHDAALARVDALEHEVTQLVAENATLRAQREAAERRLTQPVAPAPAPAPPAIQAPRDISYSNAQAASLVGAIVLFGFVLPMVCVMADRKPDVVLSATNTETTYPVSEVEACLATTPSTPDITRWDHISYVDVDALRSTELPCHLALPRLVGSMDWNRSERETLDALVQAEQRLDGIVDSIELERAGMDGEVPHNTVRIEVANDYTSALRTRNELVTAWNYIHIRR
jgi:hypothetical protein